MDQALPVPRKAGALIALALHVIAAAAFLGQQPARSALAASTPLMVSLITPPRVEPPPEPAVEVLPPKPKAKPKGIVERRPKPPEPKRIVAAPAEAPSPVVTPPPPPAPEPEPTPLAAPVAAAPAPPAPGPILPIVAPVFSADYLDNPPPRYPVLSRRAGEEGRVTLRVLVSVGGAPEEVQIRASSGHTRLDEAARDTVRRWKFVPAKRGAQPVAAWVLIPISFSLES